jgi:hypothetical protein
MNDLKVIENSLFAKHVKITKSSLDLPSSLKYEEWEHIGKTLFNMGGAIHWWIGDWIRFGEGHYGEKYSQALEDTAFDYQTLKNDVWVCSKIEKARRQDNLSFSHHLEVASLTPIEQDTLLNRAVKEEWTRSDLREAIKGKPKEHKPEEITCPYCKKAFVPNE